MRSQEPSGGGAAWVIPCGVVSDFRDSLASFSVWGLVGFLFDWPGGAGLKSGEGLKSGAAARRAVLGGARRTRTAPGAELSYAARPRCSGASRGPKQNPVGERSQQPSR